MNIFYDEVAYLESMQMLLFFINLMVTTLSYYWGSNLLLHIFQRDVGICRKLLFSILSAGILNILVVYGIALVNGLSSGVSLFYIGRFEIFTKNVLPFAYFFLYCAGVRILKLPPFKCITMMQFSYAYFLCTNLMIGIFARMFTYVVQQDPYHWNYLYDIYKLLGGTVLLYGLNRLILHVVKKRQFDTTFADNIVVNNMIKSLVKNFLICCLLYGFITLLYLYPKLDLIHCLLSLLLFLSYFLLGIHREFSKIKNQIMRNEGEHITQLNQAVEEFRGIKHDFSNILQTYSGYLEIGAYEQLKSYHKKTVGMINFAENNLDLSRRLPENPTFFSLLLGKLAYAKQLGVRFETRPICDVTELYMEPLDFNRIMAILFDNAIEAAAQTNCRQVGLFVQQKADQSKLFILANDTVQDVAVKEIFTVGYTTKTGHMGQGLAQVRNLVNRYGNVTLSCAAYKNQFIVYLEQKPI